LNSSEMSMKLNLKNVLLTGASGKIGRATLPEPFCLRFSAGYLTPRFKARAANAER